MNIEPLQKAGLTPGEIKVYLALLTIGETTSGPIAKEARVARSKLYDILDRLSAKGLVSHSIKNGTKHFYVDEPERFLDFLKRKEEEIKEQEKQIARILPELQNKYNLKEIHQEAKVFEGLQGLKNVRERYLKIMKEKNEPIYFFIVPESALETMELYYRDWNSRRIKEGVESYTIMTENSKKSHYVKEKLKQKKTWVKFLSKEEETYSWVEIYGDVVVIAINYGKPMSIVIKNKYIAQSYKNQFNILWKIAKK